MENFAIAPEVDHDSIPFWDYIKAHNVHLQKCPKCSRLRFPPLPSCPYCGELGGEWTAVSGEGTIYSWVIVYHPIDPRLFSQVPFIIAMIELKEGPRIIGRLVNAQPEQIKIGMPVKVVYEDIDDNLTLLNYEPCS